MQISLFLAKKANVFRKLQSSVVFYMISPSSNFLLLFLPVWSVKTVCWIENREFKKQLKCYLPWKLTSMQAAVGDGRLDELELRPEVFLFSVRLLCIQALHKIHVGLLVVQLALKWGGVKIWRASSGAITWMLCWGIPGYVFSVSGWFCQKFVQKLIFFGNCSKLNI